MRDHPEVPFTASGVRIVAPDVWVDPAGTSKRSQSTLFLRANLFGDEHWFLGNSASTCGTKYVEFALAAPTFFAGVSIAEIVSRATFGQLPCHLPKYGQMRELLFC